LGSKDNEPKTMFANTLVDNNVWILRGAFKKNKAPLWKALEQKASGSLANRREVNVGKLASVTKDGDTVMVPGKLLSSGSIGHKLTVCAFSFSEMSIKKIKAAGGSVITLGDLVNKYPEGKGVRIIG